MNKVNAKDLVYKDNELIITDPPYNIGYEYNGNFIDRTSQEEYQELFEPMQGRKAVIIHYIENTIRDIVPILGNPNQVVAWSYNSNAGHKEWRSISWFNCEPDFCKIKVAYKNPEDKRIKELQKRTGGACASNHWHINLVKNVSQEKIKEYTNQIPKQIIKRIIMTTAKKDDVIIDPFSGTGTTPCVAKSLGYKYKWYDINPLAIELTKKRLKTVEPKLFYYND